MNISEIADLLHVSHLEANILVDIATHGTLKKQEIVSLNSEKSQLIKNAISELIEKDLIFESEANVYKATSVASIESKIESKRIVLEAYKKIVLPSINAPDELGAQIYEGWDGIRHMYDEILEEAISTKQNIYAFESNLHNSDIGSSFLDQYVKKRTAHNINAFVICPYTKNDIQYKSRFQGSHTQVKLVKNYPIVANANIVGSKVMCFSTNPPKGSLVCFQPLADSFMQHFDWMWKVN